jgi:dihydroneopterin aldolase
MSIHPLRPLDPAETFATDAASRGLIEVFLEGLVVRAHIGVYAHEKGRSQPIEIDIRIWAALSVGSDEIASTVNYETPARIAKDLGQTIHHQLIETYLAALADQIMQDPRVEAVAVRGAKPEAIEGARAAGAALFRRR